MVWSTTRREKVVRPNRQLSQQRPKAKKVQKGSKPVQKKVQKTLPKKSQSKSTVRDSQYRPKSMARRKPSPPKKPPIITFDEKTDELEEPKQSVSGVFQDLGEDATLDELDESSLKSDLSQLETYEPSTPEKSPISPPASSPPKHIRLVDSAPISSPTQSYIPSPYVFRAPARVKQFKRINAKCPPFYIQLDHTLGVIWALFSEKPPVSLGVVQLQWALNFLKGICTKKGEHPKDVGLCILVIEEILMERYAKMVQDVVDIEEEQNKKMRERHLFPDVSWKSNTSVCESEICSGRLSMSMDRNIVEEVEVLIKEVPFSVNYSDMSERAETDIYKLHCKQSGTSTDASELEFEISQENTMEFLHQWRQDQINKIESELKRLHSIEAYIGCTETYFNNMDQAKLESIIGPDTATRRKPKTFISSRL